MSPRILTLLVAGLAFAPLQPVAAIECWTNSDGVRECGNTVPPEYAQGQIKTINERGMTVNVKERAKSREERAEELRLKAEEERRRNEEAERKAQQQRYDRVLLSTFTTEEELLASGERKTTALDATIEVTERTLSSARKTLEKHQKQAAKLEKDGRPIPDDLQEDITSLEKQVADKQAHLERKEAEKAALQQQNRADLERFRYLKSLRR